jgi:hypothetical protein
MRSMFNKEFFKCSQFMHINRCTFSLVINSFLQYKKTPNFFDTKKAGSMRPARYFSIIQLSNSRRWQKYGNAGLSLLTEPMKYGRINLKKE